MSGQSDPRSEQQYTCCDHCDYLLSILTMMHQDGPTKIGADEYDLVCRLLDEFGK